MRFVANPVIVDAHKIAKVENSAHQYGLSLTLDNGELVFAGPDMTARYTPVEGDYWVIQEDGYVYLNPKAIFERKYSRENWPKPERPKPFFEFMQPADKSIIEQLKDFEVVYARHQPEYIPLRTLKGKTSDVPVLSRWTPTEHQRAALADGADIFLQLLTFGDPLQPILIGVGDEANPEYFRERFGLPAQPVANIPSVQPGAGTEPVKIEDTNAGKAFSGVAGEITEAMKSQKPGSHDVREKVPGPHKPPKPPGTEVG